MRSLALTFFYAALVLRADVTLRYTSDVKMASFLPPEAMGQFNKSMQKGMNSNSQVIRMKGSRALTTTGDFSSLVDFDRHEFTIIDGANKRVATVPADKFQESFTANFPQMPEAVRKSMENMKTSVDSRVTGRTDSILGVQAEERELVMTVEMPIPGTEEPATMKLIMQIWTAKPGEALRVQAIRELTAYSLWTGYFMNPGKSMEKMFGMMPGFGEGMGKLMNELAQNKAVILRTHTKLYSSFLNKMAQQMQKAGKPLPENYDPDAPLMDIGQEAAELSTAPLDDALFRIPEGHETVPMADLMKALTTPKSLTEK